MSDIHTDKGFKFSTNWGNFAIGDKVSLSDEAKDNDNYSDYFNNHLVITWVDLEDDGLGKHEPIMSLSLQDGSAFPFSLYGYEIEK